MQDKETRDRREPTEEGGETGRFEKPALASEVFCWGIKLCGRVNPKCPCVGPLHVYACVICF